LVSVERYSVEGVPATWRRGREEGRGKRVRFGEIKKTVRKYEKKGKMDVRVVVSAVELGEYERRRGSEVSSSSKAPSLPSLPVFCLSFDRPFELQRGPRVRENQEALLLQLEKNMLSLERESRSKADAEQGESFVLISISHPSHEKTAALHSATK